MRYLTPKQTHDATFNSRRVSRQQSERGKGKRARERERRAALISLSYFCRLLHNRNLRSSYLLRSLASGAFDTGQAKMIDD